MKEDDQAKGEEGKLEDRPGRVINGEVTSKEQDKV
jgi:hypothetical protein